LLQCSASGSIDLTVFPGHVSGGVCPRPRGGGSLEEKALTAGQLRPANALTDLIAIALHLLA